MPSGTSLQRDFDDLYRADKIILGDALNTEHFYESASSLSAGQHKLGSARVHVGLASAVSTTADSGRLMFATDQGDLYYLSSTSSVRFYGASSLYTQASLYTQGSLYTKGQVYTKTESDASYAPKVFNVSAASVQAGTFGSGNYVVTGNMTAAAFFESSRRVLKRDIAPLTVDTGELIDSIDVVRFKYKTQDDDYEHWGIIADDTVPAITGPDGDVFDVTNTTALLLKEVQQLRVRVKELEDARV